MDFESKRKRALAVLSATGMLRKNYEPPLITALWKMGFSVPPPHFISFFGVAIFSGIWFGAVSGLTMWYFSWSESGMDAHSAMLISAISGLLFGLAMASFYANGRRKHNLPNWNML
jgi:hypothetical protein